MLGDVGRYATEAEQCHLLIGEPHLPAVRVQISRFVNASNPGWVECRMTDAWGTEWLFEEKLPVVSTDELDEHSEYPQPGLVACEIVKLWRDENDREIATIDSAKPWGVESADGNTHFDVLASQLIED